MPVVQSAVFEITPGRSVEFLDAASRSRAIQERVGAGRVAAFQAMVAGSAVGQVSYVIWHQDLAAFGRFADALNADPEWQAFWTKENLTAANPVGRMISSTLAADLPGFDDQLPAPPVPGSIIARSLFQPQPGRIVEVFANVAAWRAIAARLGITTRTTQVGVGGTATGTLIVSTLHPDMASYAKAIEVIQADPGFQALWQTISGPGSPSTPLGQTINVFLPI